jgi:PAS domain S-box-containing protein
MSISIQVLILEDRAEDAELMLHELGRAGFEPTWQRVETETDYLAHLDPAPDLILADYTMPQFTALRALHLLQERGLNIPFIVVTGTVSEEAAVECMKQVADDYLLKDRLARLGQAVTHALHLKKLRDETRRAEVALRESEKRFRALIENSSDAIALFSAEGTLIYQSSTANRMLGYSSEEMIGRDAFEHMHPDDVPAAKQAFAQLLGQPGARVCAHFRYRHKDGSWRWIEGVGTNLLAEPGVQAIVANYRDITERKRAEEAIHKSELLFRLVWENSADGMRLTNEQGTVVRVNDAFCRMVGKPKEEIEGKPLSVIYQEERREHIERRHQERFLSRTVAPHMERELTLWNGQRVWFEVSNSFFELEGQAPLLLGLFRDITERKRAGQALEESEDRYRDLVEHSHDLLCTHDLDGVILSVNQATARGLGYAPGDLVNKSIRDLLVPDVRHRFDDYLAMIREHGGANGLMRVQTAFGEERLWEYHTTVRTDGVTAPVVRATVHDITERKRMERQLAESHNLLSAVVEGTTDAIFIKDLQGRYLMVNSAAARFVGKSVEEVIGKDDSEIFSAETAAKIMEHDRQVIATGDTLTIEEIGTAAGITRTYLSTKGLYRDYRGKIIGIIGIARDMTERKELENQLRQAQKMEAIGRLAGGVAHDFNNLLTVINGYSEMVIAQLTEQDPRRKQVEEIKKAGDRAASLTRQLLAFSRRQVLTPTVLDLNVVISDMEKMLRRLIGEDIELRVIAEPELGKVKADPGQVEQVIMNLAVNARDAMPNGGTLIVETQHVTLDEDHARHQVGVAPGGYVMLAVSDTGCGMDAETVSHIFEPFFTTKGEGKGTGLGLSTVYGIVAQSGGHVTVDSKVGWGTTFRIYLPRTEETIESAEVSAETIDLPQGWETILLAEDEEMVRTLARELLRASGYQVLEAQNGVEALWLAEQHQGPIHLLLSDVVMPLMNGPDLAKQLAAKRPAMKVLFMSGYTSKAAIHHGMLDPAIPFLQKPFTLDLLALKVREVLDGEKSEE